MSKEWRKGGISCSSGLVNRHGSLLPNVPFDVDVDVDVDAVIEAPVDGLFWDLAWDDAFPCGESSMFHSWVENYVFPAARQVPAENIVATSTSNVSEAEQPLGCLISLKGNGRRTISNFWDTQCVAREISAIVRTITVQHNDSMKAVISLVRDCNIATSFWFALCGIVQHPLFQSQGGSCTGG